MGVLDTTYTFTATDVVTSAKLNNVIDQTTFTSSAFSNTTLAINSSGQLRVNTSGITQLELADNSVITAKILDANVTTAKILDANVTQAKIGTNVVGKGPAFRVYSTTTTSLPAAVFVQINLNVIQFDTNTNFNTSNNRFTPTIAGYYLISGQILSNAAPNGLIAVIYKKTDIYSYGSQTNSSAQRAMVSDIVYLNGNDDYVYLAGYAQVAATINNSNSLDTYFSGCLIRSA